MTKVYLAVFVLLFSPTHALAGASNADLRCNERSPKDSGTTISGSIPGDYAEFDLKLESAGESILMTEGKEAISVITNFSHRVFTLAVLFPDSRSLKLYAIPKSVRAKGGASREVTATFDAILVEAPKPGYTGPPYYDSLIRDISLSCTFEHAT